MTQPEFLSLLARAYHFPDYFTPNLDAADECLADLRDELQAERLPLLPLFETLLAEVPPEERGAVLLLLGDYFWPTTEETTPGTEQAKSPEEATEEE
jgi:hypothetical protein